MKFHTYLLSLVLLCLLPVKMMAEDIIVIGQVVSAVNMEPIANVNIWFKETPKIGTITNAEGYYVLRAPKHQKNIVVSALGYKREVIKLDETLRDQCVNVALQEDFRVLQEVVVMPGANPALALMREVRNRRTENNPQNFVDYQYNEQSNEQLYLVNLQHKLLQRKIFRELESGKVSNDTAGVLIPLRQHIVERNVAQGKAGNEETTLRNENETIDLLPESFVDNFTRQMLEDVNFYNNGITLSGITFVSPIARNSQLYYDYYLIDSVVVDGRKCYQVNFAPKHSKSLTFKGSMNVDSASYAIQSINAHILPTANVNFVDNISLSQQFSCVDGKYYPLHYQHSLGVQMGMKVDSLNSFSGAIIRREHQFVTLKESDKLDYRNEMQFQKDEAFSQAINSLNDSKLVARLRYIAYAVISEHIPVGPIDFGPVLDIGKLNPVEGLRIGLPIRTNQKMCDWFTVGANVGYGFKDKEVKYGGNMQFRWGNDYAHTIGVHYNKDVYRQGSEYAELLKDNMVSVGECFSTSWPWGNNRLNLTLQQRAALRYRYEVNGFRLMFETGYTRYHGNDITSFARGGDTVPYFNAQSAALSLRIAPHEKSTDFFFRKYHLRNRYPVINFLGAVGHYSITEGSETVQNIYGKLSLSINQHLPTPIGYLDYALLGEMVFGKVPYYLLATPRTTRGAWANNYDFYLLNQQHVLADAVVAAHVHLFSNGWIFNYIPYVNRLNLRECLFVKTAWTTTWQNHSEVLNMPDNYTFRIPYVELGFGICNILKIAKVDFAWRVTHRNEPNGSNFNVVLRLQLGT